MIQKVIVLYNEVLTDNPDELDVINQRDLVKDSCEKLGYEVSCMTVGDKLLADIQKVKQAEPDVVFNLVEASWGKGELIYFAPAVLNSLKIPFTGVPLDALFLTTNKVLAKKFMQNYGLPTAPYFSTGETSNLDPQKTYIVKPIWEEASVGISSDSIFNGNDKEKLSRIKTLSSNHFFIEEFIDGREFNVSILSDSGKPEVLPPAEIIFSGFFNDKPKIVDYKAKWDSESEEYKQTNRAFDTLNSDPELLKELADVCRKSWEVFNLKGYARVDVRVDEKDNIYILEINGNPCIAPDSGFVAALGKVGYSIEMMMKRILNDLN